MRNQPIPACEGSAGIRHSYAGDDFSVEAGHSAKAKPDLPERRDWSSDPWALHRAARLQERNAHGPCNGKLNPEEEGCTERSVISQPKFVFEKKVCPLKISLVVRESVQDHHLLLSRSLTLGLTQIQLLFRKEGDHLPFPSFLPSLPSSQLSEDSYYSSAENSESTERTVKSSTSMDLSSSKITQSQLLVDRSVQNSSNSDFVFGENMVERVLVRFVNAGRRFTKSPEKHPKPCNEVDLYKGEVTSMHIESFYVSPQTTLLRNATLTESAAAFISKPMEKILLDKVEVITGEEAEHNVLQINCKLFVFNKLSLTWIERGRGSLRLNDTSSNKHGMLQSRLIMRNQGNLRLILNTRLWDQMVIKRANRKSLCFTATDQEDHSVQVFLIQASSKDTGCLYAAIHHRLVALRSSSEQETDANQLDTESEIAFQPLNCDSDDDDDEEVTQVSSSGSDHSRWNRRQSVVCL
ncbi:ran-binding protein 3-like isoform X5 [Columba livia]|uniref:ran-binding protein 3-like isoform X5 n=1 Tax=Columba livia TaxID=8932 RepID=UPI0031BB7B2A